MGSVRYFFTKIFGRLRHILKGCVTAFHYHVCIALLFWFTGLWEFDIITGVVAHLRETEFLLFVSKNTRQSVRFSPNSCRFR